MGYFFMKGDFSHIKKIYLNVCVFRNLCMCY